MLKSMRFRKTDDALIDPHPHQNARKRLTVIHVIYHTGTRMLIYMSILDIQALMHCETKK